MNEAQWQFLHSELLMLTRAGTFQRSGVYAPGCPEKTRRRVRLALSKWLSGAGEHYKTTSRECDHVARIVDLAEHMTSHFGSNLRGGRFRIGVAQKALNLYLKYLWCAGRIPMPPHCPFDARIISRLRFEAPVRWTKLDSIQEYELLVRAARAVAGDQPLAAWELGVWNEGE